jgi:hypothetical protein
MVVVGGVDGMLLREANGFWRRPAFRTQTGGLQRKSLIAWRDHPGYQADLHMLPLRAKATLSW